jgi:hypothetical protein
MTSFNAHKHHGSTLKTLSMMALWACLIIYTPSAKAQTPNSAAQTQESRAENVEIIKFISFSRPNTAALHVKELRQERARGTLPSRTVLVGLDARLDNGLVFTADEIVMTGTFDPARVDLVIITWLRDMRLIVIDGGALPSTTALAASLSTKNLTVYQNRFGLERRVRFDAVTFSDVNTRDGRVTFSDIAGSNFSHIKQSMSPGGPLDRRSPEPQLKVQVERFSLSGIDPNLFDLLGQARVSSNSWPSFSQLKAAKVSLEKIDAQQRGQLRARKPDTLSIDRVSIDKLDLGTMQAFDLRRLQAATNSGPNLELSVAQMSGRNWSNRPYMRLAQFIDRRNSDRQFDDREPVTVDSLWSGGPLDIGIEQFDLRDLKLAMGGFDVALSRFAILTRKAISGVFERFEIPRGQLDVTLRASNIQSSIARDLAGLFRLLKLDVLRISWQGLATFDPALDRTTWERVILTAPDFFRLAVSGNLLGVQTARQKLSALDVIDGFALLTASQARARRQRLGDSLKYIRVDRLFAQLHDTGGLERVAQAWADRRRAKALANGLTSRDVRSAWASALENRYRVTPINTRAENMILFAPWIKGAKDWLQVGGTMTATFSPRQPIGLEALTRHNPQAVDAVKVRHRLP